MLDILDIREDMTPTVWRQVESFPMTGSGKIQKFMLRDQFIAGEYEETMP